MFAFERLAELAGRRAAARCRNPSLPQRRSRAVAFFVVRAGELGLVRCFPFFFFFFFFFFFWPQCSPRLPCSPTDITATHWRPRDSSLLAVPIATARAALERDAVLAAELTRHLAGEVQRMRARAEILSFKSAADRIEAWLALNGEALPLKGRWNQVASEIGISPEALYRASRAAAPAGNDGDQGPRHAFLRSEGQSCRFGRLTNLAGRCTRATSLTLCSGQRSLQPSDGLIWATIGGSGPANVVGRSTWTPVFRQDGSAI